MTGKTTQTTSRMRALLSVTDKSGITDLAKGLVDLGYEIVSTGGTRRVLLEANIPVVSLEEVTGHPEMLDGRVKTLHPAVHGGILFRRDDPKHVETVQKHGIGSIDLVAVNLYDFAGKTQGDETSMDHAIEEIDIGGPTLLRASAKNHAFVIPLVDPADYGWILERLRVDGALDGSTRAGLARKVFQHTAAYDAGVAAFFDRKLDPEGADFAAQMSFGLSQVSVLRYGENPHQGAALYRAGRVDSGHANLVAARQLQGKALSYNNYLDLDSAYSLALEFDEAVCVYVKHNNACGVAAMANVEGAVRAARAADSVSAFGAVVAINREVDEASANAMCEAFLEAVIAPSYSEGALQAFAAKKNVRVLLANSFKKGPPSTEIRRIRGGFLAQHVDERSGIREELAGAQVVTTRAPSEEEMRGLRFVWTVAKHIRSNAIVFGQGDRTLAVGAGQMSRVDSVKICRLKAADSLKGSVVASDAFFPFRDGVEVLAEAGATAIVQPGGSIRDEEVIGAANEFGLAMLFTGVRHFRH